VLAAGVQRIGQVAADLLRFANSQGTANTIAVAPDAIAAAGIVNTLPVASFPDRAPTLGGGGNTLCATFKPGPSGDPGIAFLAGNGLPVPAGRVPVTLSQADGPGPALDAVYLPPGRSANARGNGRIGTRYLVTDTGVRFAPWPVLVVLPPGPELSRQNASVARDAVAGAP
jgi:Type VII secretion system ESX-1, transport TM domain B